MQLSCFGWVYSDPRVKMTTEMPQANDAKEGMNNVNMMPKMQFELGIQQKD